MEQQTQASSITGQKPQSEPQTQPQYKTGPIMAALLVAGFVGLFSETALNIAFTELSAIFAVDATTIQWLL